MVKVAHLTSVHPAFDTRVFHKECRALAEAGYEVVLIVPHPQDEVVHGVRVRALPKPASRKARLTRTLDQVFQAAMAENASVYHFHDPELIGVALKLKGRGKRVVYDVHEDVPRQIAAKHWIAPPLRRPIAAFAEWAEHAAASRLDAIVTATPTISARFPKDKTLTVFNYPSLAELALGEMPAFETREPLAVYIGAMHATRGAREMVAAMGRLPEALEARLALGGDYRPAALEDELRAMPGAARTDFLGWVDRTQVASLLGRARVGLVTLHPTQSYLDSYPVKLFEYMAAGIPFIASDFPLWREFMGGAEAGLFVDPLDPGAIARAIEHLLTHPAEAAAMGARGRELVTARFNWETEAEKLIRLYDRLTETTR